MASMFKTGSSHLVCDAQTVIRGQVRTIIPYLTSHHRLTKLYLPHITKVARLPYKSV